MIQDYRYPDYHGVQLHPRDTGAVMIEFNATSGGEALDGPYHPAGPTWQRAVSSGAGGIAAVRVRAQDPATMAQRWSQLFAQPARPFGVGASQAWVISLALGRIEFVKAAPGQADALVELVLSHAPASANLPRSLCGVRVSA